MNMLFPWNLEWHTSVTLFTVANSFQLHIFRFMRFKILVIIRNTNITIKLKILYTYTEVTEKCPMYGVDDGA